VRSIRAAKPVALRVLKRAKSSKNLRGIKPFDGFLGSQRRRLIFDGRCATGREEGNYPNFEQPGDQRDPKNSRIVSEPILSAWILLSRIVRQASRVTLCVRAAVADSLLENSLRHDIHVAHEPMRDAAGDASRWF